MGHSKGSTERGVHSYAELPKEDRKISNKQLTLNLQLEEQPKTKPRARRGIEITKIRAELNDKETKRTIQRIN